MTDIFKQANSIYMKTLSGISSKNYYDLPVRGLSIVLMLLMVVSPARAQLEFSDHVTLLQGKFKKKQYACLRELTSSGFSAQEGTVGFVKQGDITKIENVKKLKRQLSRKIKILAVAYKLSRSKKILKRLRAAKKLKRAMLLCLSGALPPSIVLKSSTGTGMALNAPGSWQVKAFNAAIHGGSGGFITSWLEVVDQLNTTLFIKMVGKLIDKELKTRQYSCQASYSGPDGVIKVTNSCTFGINYELDGFITFRIDINIAGIDFVYFISKTVPLINTESLGNFNGDARVGLEDVKAFQKCFKASARGQMPAGCQRGDFNGDGKVDMKDVWNPAGNITGYQGLETFFGF
ncbi:MAG: hypothetical protein D6719_12525 [Candidatus Dadabacteria bacterium]|nr:MAG: hypothetical protein D6719_12525 [Candidatus Dadabacteria bacterium]